MPVSCPDSRQSVLVGADNHPLSTKCPACGIAPSVRHDDTLEYRSDEPPLPDRFQLLERVGVGAFGSVWKTYDKDLDRTVAVKVPRDGQFDTCEAKRFLQEGRTSAQLKHPNIVSVHEVGGHREGIYIVAEYVAGQTLTEWLKQQRPTGREAAELCRVIAEAIHYAHEAGVIHRDLKPANIIVDASGDQYVGLMNVLRYKAELTDVDSLDGAQVAESDREEDDRESLQDQLASTEPALQLKVENREALPTFQNLKEVKVNFYEMDIEFLFSANPFVESSAERFSVIKPNYSAVVRLMPIVCRSSCREMGNRTGTYWPGQTVAT